MFVAGALVDGRATTPLLSATGLLTDPSESSIPWPIAERYQELIIFTTLLSLALYVYGITYLNMFSVPLVILHLVDHKNIFTVR